MDDNLQGVQSYTAMMYSILANIKEGIAAKKFKETKESLSSLGYTNEEIKEILKSMLNKVSCN